MKIDQIKKELENMPVDELQKKLTETRKELFTLRLNAVTSHVINYAAFKQLRKNIARILTILKTKEKEGQA